MEVDEAVSPSLCSEENSFVLGYNVRVTLAFMAQLVQVDGLECVVSTERSQRLDVELTNLRHGESCFR